MKRTLSAALVAASLTLACGAASADPIFWADWTGTDTVAGPGFGAQGTITTSTSTLTVSYTNSLGVGFYQPSGGTDYYIGRGAGASPYTSSRVDNRPTGTDIIALQFAGTQTLQFSQTIANPVFAFVSLNGNGYAFDQDFEILSVGGVDGHACGYWGCGGVTKEVVDLGNGRVEYQLNSNNVGGTEPHGTLRFLGTFDTVTWRSSTNEFWNGFTVGIQGTAVEVCSVNPTAPGCEPGPGPSPVPVPGTLALLAIGMAGLGLGRRARR